MRRTLQALIAVILCLSPAHGLTHTAQNSARTRARETSAQQLKRDLDAMKQQMQQMQEKIRKQEEVIQKLSAQPSPPPLPAAPTAAATDTELFKREVKED